MQQKPIFLLGLGFQKAGTTWLNAHLSQHPDTAFRHNLTKELNLGMSGFQRKPNLIWEPRRFWNSVKCELQLRQHLREGVPGSFDKPLLGQPRRKVLWRFASTGAMHRMFLRWSRPTPEHPRGLVVGDITPYAIYQPEPQLERLVTLLREDFDVRPFVIWRDPLTRLDSAMKHTRRRPENQATKDLEHFCKYGFIAGWAGNGHYALAVERLNDMFPDAHELIYEELFGPDGQAQLDAFHRFAGLSERPGDFGMRIHDAGKSEIGLNPEQRLAARGFLQVQYDVMVERFGADRLAPIWNI